MDSSVGSLFDLCLCFCGCFFLDRSADRLRQYKYSFSVSLLICSLACCLLVDHLDCGLFASFMIQSECNPELERGSINEK